MALEKECDTILLVMYELMDKINLTKLEDELKRKGETISHEDVGVVMAILLTEGLIEGQGEIDKNQKLSKGTISITMRGIAFLNTDTFVERRERWELDKNTKRLEYSLKKRTFGIAIAGVLISLFSLYNSCSMKNTNNNSCGNDNIQSHISNGVHKL